MNLLLRIIIFVSLLQISTSATADDSIQSIDPDTITDESFISTSLLIASPGDVLYSRVGHCAIRMQCPSQKLDYVYSYESEDAKQKILSFLAGNLKMGMFAVPTQEYIKLYKEDGRGVTEYPLNIPIEGKRNLWRVLDSYFMQGANLPYDYIIRGCAHSTLMLLKEGLDTLQLEYGPWPEKFTTMTRRELTRIQMETSPWSWLFMNIICNGSINDEDCSLEDKVIMPIDLVYVLTHAKLQGKPLVSDKPKTLSVVNINDKPSTITPTMVALALLLLTLVCLLLRKGYMDYVLLTVQTLIGIVNVYLIFFSTLCCTEWSWLIVPCNPLPLILWRWRKHWALPYAGIILIWAAAMLFSPHQLTTTPFVIFAFALIASYVGIHIRHRHS
ncbi:MAG: DUF4105 domain-containing protein [Prevotellaceae bacterium]|nr:DUF4105 domain-containing protein [Prevotellaceae bacterium]